MAKLATNPNRIHAARLARGLTAVQAGEAVGLGKGAAAGRAWERLEELPSTSVTMDTITKIGKVLCVCDFDLVSGLRSEPSANAAGIPDLLAALKTLSCVSAEFIDATRVRIGDDVLKVDDDILLNSVGLAFEAARESLLALLSN